MIYTYARVSTAKQADDSESLDVQQRVMDGYALMHGLTVDKAFVERGISGSTPLVNRPEGAALLAVVKVGDIVITSKLDRMFRSALDALNVLKAFKDQQIHLHMIDVGGDVTNGISKLMFTILSAVAEAERDRIRERVAGAKADAKARGAYLGGKVPFGYEVIDGMLHPIAAKQPYIHAIRHYRKEGYSLRNIRDNLGLTLSLDAISRIADGRA